jgi:hypothetical protein
VALVMVARSWGGIKKLVGQICPDTKKGGEYIKGIYTAKAAIR